MAQCRLGELTKEIKPNITGRPQKYSEVRNTFPTRKEKLSELGITYQRANEYERMAAYPEAVQKISMMQSATVRIAQNPKLQEAQEIAEAVLDAEVQIGKLTAAIPKASGGDRKSKDFKIRNGAEFEKSKFEALKEAGINQDTSERFERIAKYPEAVEKAKEEARQEGRHFTEICRTKAY